ncbi:MAG TPA: hypothetical protein VFT29_09735 [Gemmatimonadaceae bacterium]|nr:hypothetical protein [Gemmatimonadaceae bacterium]
MRRSLSALLVVGLVAVAARDAAAQPSLKDVAAYAALSSTPVGALVPLAYAPMAKGGNALVGRFSHYSPSGGGDGTNNLGATWLRQANTSVGLSGTAGYIAPSCDACDGMFIAGVDGNFGLWNTVPAKGSTTSTAVDLTGSFGYGKPQGGSAMSLAVGLPLSFYIDQANKSKIALSVVPGFGWGQLKDDASGASESGTRPMIGAAGSWTMSSGWGISAGYQKVVIENGGNVFGLGISYRPM